MSVGYVTEDEARKMLFSPDARPSLSAWQRMRRQLELPHFQIGRFITYDLAQLRDHLETHHRFPKPE